MRFWLAVLVIALGTYLYRLSFLSGRLNFKMPELVREALSLAPVSVMATLVALGFFVNQAGEFNLDLPGLITALAATFVAWRFGRDILTIVAGLAVYWAADLLLGRL
ncbi:MAG: AzlD domain-containing protein [Candidatus Adiutrix sp.]|jgi:branched-subunit amino acid transport protein|nr:AzlD domain-containing protein [Candidatus Adiutrix sp.]